MRSPIAVTALLAATFALASPTVADGVVGVTKRAEAGSISDLSSQLETIKGLVNKDISSSESPSTADVNDITDRIIRAIDGLVPVDLGLLNGGDLLDLLGVLDSLDGIVGGLTQNLPTNSLETRQLSYAPIIEVLYPLLTSVSKLVSEVLTTAYGAIGSSAAQNDAEITQKILSGTRDLSKDTGILFGLLGGLGN